MEWYGWVLIALGLAGFAYLKVKVGGAWMEKRRLNKKRREQSMEDED